MRFEVFLVYCFIVGIGLTWLILAIGQAILRHRRRKRKLNEYIHHLEWKVRRQKCLLDYYRREK